MSLTDDDVIFALDSTNDVMAKSFELSKKFVDFSAHHIYYDICKHLKIRYSLLVFGNGLDAKFEGIEVSQQMRNLISGTPYLSCTKKNIGSVFQHVLSNLNKIGFYPGKRHTIIVVSFGEPSDKQDLELQTKEAISKG